MKPRMVRPEILDELPAADPRAVGSRADLARLNIIMGHAGIFARLWPVERPPLQVVEVGAGDGVLCWQILRRLPPAARPRRVTLVDRQSLLANATRQRIEALGIDVVVVQADVFAWLARRERFDLGLANLFLHHFKEADLRSLLAEWAALGRVFLAVEPRRSILSGVASRMLGVIGCNAVTRHDAAVSVQAGFAGNELSRCWPAAGEWTLIERRAGLFSHQFRAERRED